MLPRGEDERSFVPVSRLILRSSRRQSTGTEIRNVLVVGAGNSGLDIASHLVEARATVTLSMRTPPNLASRDLFGIPGQPMLVYLSDHLPRRVADAAFAVVQRLSFGDLRPWGIPRASLGVYSNYRRHHRNPAIDDGFIDSVKRGWARVVGEVDRLDGADVVLRDGTRLQPDAVICATGYRRGLEMLVGHLGVLDTDGVPTHHAGAAPAHPRAPRLYFCGMWGQFSGQIRLAPIHARRIARAATRDRQIAERA